jgi:hypothetical protein
MCGWSRIGTSRTPSKVIIRRRGAPVATAKPDCGDPQLLCPEVVDSEAGFGYYVGHDEDQVAFYSTVPGSGNRMQYQLTLPTEPSGAYSSLDSYNFEILPQFWFGVALCDTQSYPEQTKQCKADSDRNIVDPATNPDKVPGSAFGEFQFFAPGSPASGCDPTRWCAALATFSWSQNAANGDQLNDTCQSQIYGGIEYSNFAVVTLDGKPLGPPDPLHIDAASLDPANPDTLFMGQGDRLTVDLDDTSSGLQATIQDTTTGQTGSMVASAANGFGQVEFAPHGRSCTVLPYDFHPMYSTSTPETRISWAAHSTNVTFTAELGHFDFCSAVTSEGGNCDGLEGPPGDERAADSDDVFCFGPAPLPFYPVGGCLGANTGFDGPSYQKDWPDGNPSHPTPVAFSSPRTGSTFTTPYSQVGFETNLPVAEASGLPVVQSNGPCNLATGSNCTLPPPSDDGTPAAFYPYFSAVTAASGCSWELGNVPAGANVNDFGQESQFGAPTPEVYYSPPFGASHGRTAPAFTDFRNILPNNPC